MMKTFELKVGDKIELRKGLEEGKWYGIIRYFNYIPKNGFISLIDSTYTTIRTDSWWYAVEMISKVNDKRVKFTDGFEYTIMEDEND